MLEQVELPDKAYGATNSLLAAHISTLQDFGITDSLVQIPSI
jgi:hypothetical protein